MDSRAGYRLVIFDFDGTLADSFPWLAAELNAVAARWRFKPVAPGESERLRQQSAREILRHLCVPAWKLPLVAADLRRRMTADIDAIRRFDGVDAMLGRLQGAGIELGIATSNSAENVRRVLGPACLRCIRRLETGASIHGKGVRLLRMQRAAGVAPEQVLYIGDELRDIEAARKAGVGAGAVGWGYNRPEALQRARPDLFFDNIHDIATRLTP
ncbi:HAD hydrolase-like protein [Thiohalocapsa sp. ML1]|uniref:HAD hydrolase-like protein n=1 Tax=Thiohalocapsa sp. ML1 TaxID=1431688 RepID=UPI0007320AED|nr:HAD hydrolase-like protein [Thiohalocapsa sp. ML1]